MCENESRSLKAMGKNVVRRKKLRLCLSKGTISFDGIATEVNPLRTTMNGGIHRVSSEKFRKLKSFDIIDKSTGGCTCHTQSHFPFDTINTPNISIGTCKLDVVK